MIIKTYKLHFFLIVLMLMVISIMFSNAGGAKLASKFIEQEVTLTFIPYKYFLSAFSAFGSYKHNVGNLFLTSFFFYFTIKKLARSIRDLRHYVVICTLFYPTLWYYNLYALRDIMIFVICFVIFWMPNRHRLLFLFLSLILIILRAEFVFFVCAALYRFISKKSFFLVMISVTIIALVLISSISMFFGLDELSFETLRAFANVRHSRQFAVSDATTAFIAQHSSVLDFSAAVRQVAYFFSGGLIMFFDPLFSPPLSLMAFSVLETIIFIVLFLSCVKSGAFKDVTVVQGTLFLIQFLVIFLIVSNYVNLLRLKLPFFGVLVAFAISNMARRPKKGSSNE